MRILPLRVYRWASIAVRYPPLQRRQTSPSSRQSQGRNLLGRIRPHRPMVNSDQPRPSSHLLFLHFTSRPIKCISPSSDCFFSGSGLRGEACSGHLGERIGSIVTPGLVCNAARRMTFRKSLDPCSARPATRRCGQDFGRTIRILDCEDNQVTRQSGISSIGLPIISYSTKHAPSGFLPWPHSVPPFPSFTVDSALIKSPVHRSGNNYPFFHTLPIPSATNMTLRRLRTTYDCTYDVKRAHYLSGRV